MELGKFGKELARAFGRRKALDNHKIGKFDNKVVVLTYSSPICHQTIYLTFYISLVQVTIGSH